MNKLRARVQPCPTHQGHWTASVNFPGLPFGKVTCSYSWPEAMQLAYKLIADIDQRLMNEVHESRAARRAAMDRHPAGKARQEPTA